MDGASALKQKANVEVPKKNVHSAIWPEGTTKVGRIKSHHVLAYQLLLHSCFSQVSLALPAFLRNVDWLQKLWNFKEQLKCLLEVGKMGSKLKF